ncbi:MAG: hypothetical protein BZ136_01340 [Methanosphaera sp. rholeuAM74]|nr:MAG: hypothetical protein BZ136_01340 [Methanosphaera sp. rholeuAM74]
MESNEKLLIKYLNTLKDDYLSGNEDDFDQLYEFLDEFTRNYSRKVDKLANLRRLNKSLQESKNDLLGIIDELDNKHDVLMENYDILHQNNINLNKDYNISSIKYEKSLATQEDANIRLKTLTEEIDDVLNDKQHYMQLLYKLELIINLINQSSIPGLDVIKKPVPIEYTPYYMLLKDSELFDGQWYKDEYLEDDTIDPLEHYLLYGVKNGYNPSKNFNTKWYAEKYLDNKTSINPLADYLLHGRNMGRHPLPPYTSILEPCTADTQDYRIIKESTLIDEDWYRSEYNIDSSYDVIEDYINRGRFVDCKPNKDFDVEWYKNEYNVQSEDVILDYLYNQTARLTHSVDLCNDIPDYEIIGTYLYDSIIDYNLLDTSEYKREYGIDEDDAVKHYLMKGYNAGNQLNADFVKAKYEQSSIYPFEDALWNYIYMVARKSVGNDTTNYFQDTAISLEDTQEYRIIDEENIISRKYYDDETYTQDPVVEYMENGVIDIKDSVERFVDKDYESQYDVTTLALSDYILNNRKKLLTSTGYETTTEDLQEYSIIKNSQYFDEDYYTSQYLDGDESIDAVSDYLSHYPQKIRNPAKNIDIQAIIDAGIHDEATNPLVSYILEKKDDTAQVEDESTKTDEYYINYSILETSPYFDEDYYVKHHPELDESMDVIDYYLTRGRYEKYNTSKYFDKNEYFKYNPDLEAYGVDPVVHYTKSGRKEKRRFKRSRLDMDELVAYDKSIIEYYNVIYDSDFFDEYYYTEHNSQVEDRDLDPILHYILIGSKNNSNPCSYFSTKRYLEVYGDVRRSGVNPLYHYLKNGVNEQRYSFMPTEAYPNYHDGKYKVIDSKRIYDQLHERVSIIIPIYNAYEETYDCITSVLRNTHTNYRLILINDCSSDARIKNLLDNLEDIDNIIVVHNKSNQGFVRNVNHGISLAGRDDVVLLNSDTIVTPKWLSRLTRHAYKRESIGTVTPITNSSDLCVPSLGDSDDQRNLNLMAYQVDKLSTGSLLEAPTGNGFCLYIKRECIDKVGLFDESFGRGYGEETDFTQRAINAGFINIRDDSVFVYHKRHASFTKKNTAKLKQENQKILKKRYPNVFSDWDNFINSSDVITSLKNIEDNVNPIVNAERVLCVTEFVDDQPQTDRNMRLLSIRYNTIILAVDEDTIRVYNYASEELSLIDKWDINIKLDEDKYRNIYFNILSRLKVDIVYMRDYRRLYYPTNRDVTSFIDMLPYFEVGIVNESFVGDDDIFTFTEPILNPYESLTQLVEKSLHKIDFKSNKMAVYTAVTGNYDEPLVPSYVNDEFDYICFTDNPYLTSDFWDVRLMDDESTDAVRLARKYKILPHKYLSEYDYSLWIDTNFEITGDLTRYINDNIGESSLLAVRHEHRNCIYEEAIECIKSHKDDKVVIDNQMNRYRSEGYPESNGLIASGILFRKHDDRTVKKVMEDWLYEVEHESYRDQLSFNYVCWKNNFQYDDSMIFYPKNEYFLRHDHKLAAYFRRTIEMAYDTENDIKFDEDDTDRILDSFNTKTSIIIPIYNAYEDTKECIESVLEHTHIDYELFLINDCSSDERIKTLLDGYEQLEHVKVIHNKENMGFIKNVNMGFTNTSSDVVLLNSDTVVTPKWLRKLKISAYTDDLIATVTPVSNSAGAFSVPERGVNHLVDGLSIDDMANILDKISDERLILTPTGNGFCMYIKREAIHEVGFFDQKYGMGYGEENDFCMRLVRKGWIHVVDPSIYVYHKQSASFGEQKNELLMKNIKTLKNTFPEYDGLVKEFLSSSKFKQSRQMIDEVTSSLHVDSVNRKRVLFVIHNGSGGTLHNCIDVIKNIADDMDGYLLITGKGKIELYQFNRLFDESTLDRDNYSDDEFKNYLNLIRAWPTYYDYSLLDDSIEQLKTIYFNVLVHLKIDLVHIFHLVRSSFDMPRIAGKLAIPVVLSLHDFYYLCPSHNLLDDNMEYCGGNCTPLDPESPNNGQCNVMAGLNIPIMKTVVHRWRDMVRDMFKNITAFVAFGHSTYDIYTDFYPELKDKTFNIIEHGYDIATPDSTEFVTIPDMDEPIRILFPGHIGNSKGYQLIKDIKRLDDGKLEYHYMGSVYGFEDLLDYGEYHGFYNRSHFSDIVHKIKPHFIGILSIWPETYCYTLTESWASGIPVITLDIGALGERVKSNGGGFFIDRNPEKAYEDILEIASDTDEYMKVASQIPKIRFKTTKQMADEYLRLYMSLL